MPRPTIINAKRQPVPPLNLEELKFWLRIMEEHALFVKAGLSCDNPGLINEADTFQQGFATLQAQLEGGLNERRFAELVAEARTVVGDFYRYSRRLLHLSLTCQILGCNFALFLDHISRETEYVLQLLDKLGDGQLPLYQVSSAREAAFWLRLMADHAEFFDHWLDPSERNLIETASDFAGDFDELYLQGRDFVSMLRGEVQEIPSFRRFLQDARVSTARLRDFLRATAGLIEECRLLGLVSVLLVDHMRRESDHFLLILAFLEKESYVPFDEDGEMEYAPLVEKAPAAEVFVPPPPPPPVPAPRASHPPMTYTDDDEDDKESVFDYSPQGLTGLNLSPAPLETDSEAPEPELAEAKYKWSGKWPRPLGTKSK